MGKKKIYVITGANRGIGFAITKELSHDSNNVIIAASRNPEKSQELAELKTKNQNVHTVKLDVQSKESALAAAEEVKSITGGVVDVLISNAGISDARSTVLETTSKSYEDHWKTNFLGAVRTYQAFYPLMQNSSIKQIGIISSYAGSIGGYIPASISAYGSSKAAVNYLARTIAFELKNEGFTVASIHPGMVMSDMGKAALSGIEYDESNKKVVLAGIEIALITPEESASQILKTLKELPKSDTFLNFDGSELPW